MEERIRELGVLALFPSPLTHSSTFFLTTTTVVALFVEQVVFVLVERKGAYYLYFRATTICMLDGLFNL